MANRQTEYTRNYRTRLRRDAYVYHALKEMALDNPELMAQVREAERQADARIKVRQAS
jgi:hypothetical protein